MTAVETSTLTIIAGVMTKEQFIKLFEEGLEEYKSTNNPDRLNHAGMVFQVRQIIDGKFAGNFMAAAEDLSRKTESMNAFENIIKGTN